MFLSAEVQFHDSNMQKQGVFIDRGWMLFDF